jgi:hypothetical protein
MNQIHLDILRENIETLNLSADWVRHSYEQTAAIEPKMDNTLRLMYMPKIIICGKKSPKSILIG